MRPVRVHGQGCAGAYTHTCMHAASVLLKALRAKSVLTLPYNTTPHCVTQHIALNILCRHTTPHCVPHSMLRTTSRAATPHHVVYHTAHCAPHPVPPHHTTLCATQHIAHHISCRNTTPHSVPHSTLRTTSCAATPHHTTPPFVSQQDHAHRASPGWNLLLLAAQDQQQSEVSRVCPCSFSLKPAGKHCRQHAFPCAVPNGRHFEQGARHINLGELCHFWPGHLLRALARAPFPFATWTTPACLGMRSFSICNLDGSCVPGNICYIQEREKERLEQEAKERQAKLAQPEGRNKVYAPPRQSRCA